MANPCVIIFKGKEYSFAEFASMLHDGLLEELVKSGEVDGSRLKTYKGDITPPTVQKTEEFTGREQTPEIEQGTPAKEQIPLTGENKPSTTEISPDQTTSEGNVPPTGESGSNEVVETPKGKEREKSLLNRMHNTENLSAEFRKKLEEKGLTYTSIPNSATAQDVDFLMADTGLEGAEKAIFNKHNGMEPRIRALTSSRLIKALDELADKAESEGEAWEYRKRAVEIADFIDKEGRSWGEGIQMFGSVEVNNMLAPKTQVVRMKKELRRQRDNKIEENKKDISGKSRELNKVNKESVDEVLNSKTYQELKDRIAELERQVREGNKERPTKEKNLQDKIKTEQSYRKTQWDAFKKASGTLSSSAIGFNKEQIEAIGNIVASYVREGTYRAEDIVTRLKKDWFKNTGKILSDDEAKQLLPDKIGDKTLTEIEEEGATKDNADRLVKRIERMLEDPKIPKDDPVRQLIDTLFEKVKGHDTKEKKPPTKKEAIEKIREALQSRDEYADTWEEAKERLVQKINSNPELSEEQRSEYNKRLAGFYNELIGKPFSEGQAEQATRKAIKDLDINIDKVIRDHYTVYDATKRTLQEKLVDELGLGEEEAKLLSDAVGKSFDKIAIAKKKSALKRGVTVKEKIHPKEAKQLHDKLIELTNMGAFSDAEFAEAYADKWGFPTLSPEQAQKLEGLAKAVQDAPEGYQKFEKIQDMLAYAENIKGIDMGDVYMSLWYSSILSGYRTQAKNIVQNTITSLFEGAISSARHPLYAHKLVEGITKGWGEGIRQFGHIMKTGYNPIKGYKVESPAVQERFFFKGGEKNPLNWGKYVTRFMVAADAFSYAGLKEMRSYEVAMNLARAENANATEPTKGTWARANEILNKTKERVQIAEQTATDEGLKGNEYKRRVWELMEQGRPRELVEDAAHFAAHGTFNHTPEGVLGLMSEGVSHMTQGIAFDIKAPFSNKSFTVRPGKFIIPFTRIIANVTNMAMDYYPPVGFMRAATGSMGAKPMESMELTKPFYRKYTPEERQKVLIKAMVGLSAQIGLYLLTQPDDDGNSAIEITAKGYGDYKKNYELKETGWQEYSIKIGDKWFSYQYTPLMLALAPLGYLRDMQKYNKQKVKEETLATQFGLAMFKGIQVIPDMTWAASLNGLMDAFKAQDPSEAQSYMTNLVATTTKGFIYPKIAEQITQVVDAAQQNPRHEGKDLVARIFRDIPIARSNYSTMLNAVGEPIMYDPILMTSKAKSDPFWEYLADNNITIGKPNQKETFYDDISKTERAMTDQEYYDFVRVSGQEIKSRIEKEVIEVGLKDGEAKKAVSDIKSEVRQKVKTEMFGWGDLRMKYPNDWLLIKNNGALQVPKSSEELLINDKKVRMTEDQLKEFNGSAMELYRLSILDYFRKNNIEADKKRIIDNITGDTQFDWQIKNRWSNATTKAKAQMKKALETNKSK